jgi:arabinan endo-1,5-alpha-L-arabinosidase
VSGVTRRRVVATAVALAVVIGGGAYVLAVAIRPAYRNPVFDNDAPDPTIIRGTDGAYYAYVTQTYVGAQFMNIPILRSSDLVNWEAVGDAFPENPEWARQSPGEMWAPHIVAWDDGTYRLYFSAGRRLEPEMAIGVATAESPRGPFTDAAEPIMTGEGFTAIDPFVLAAPDGVRYLVWGSDRSPILAQRLSDDGLDVVGKRVELLAPSPADYEDLIEGAWITEHDGRYYLFYSGDNCCGEEAHYAVMVARADQPLGPYKRSPANPILAANDAFNAPGHNAVIEGPDGQDWIVYHAMARDEGSSFRFLFVDRIDWVDGWPVINDGSGPSGCSTDAPGDFLPRLPVCPGD